MSIFISLNTSDILNERAGLFLCCLLYSRCGSSRLNLDANLISGNLCSTRSFRAQSYTFGCTDVILELVCQIKKIGSVNTIEDHFLSYIV